MTQSTAQVHPGVQAPRQESHRLGLAGWLFAAWILLALASLVPVTALLQSSFPVFTVVWLVVPLVALLMWRDVSRVGLGPVPWADYLKFSAVALGIELLLAAVIEPWSGTYGTLVDKAVSSTPLDPTFGWLVRYDMPLGWAGMFLFSALVTIFGEELFFRGWLLQLLLRHMGQVPAIALQAFLFTLPQSLAALVMAPLQGALYAVVYSFVAIGLVGGWVAARTNSIWPSLTSAVLLNGILVAILL